ncbi:hypothetical protein TNCV_3585071 [Trichonephila clavipes]|nr:hypothetical protein TNCV_3585071 [Trichonephila clavipes]
MGSQDHVCFPLNYQNAILNDTQVNNSTFANSRSYPMKRTLVEWLRQQTKLPHLSEANPQVYVATPLHPEKLTVWCALWAGGPLLQKR